jgi:hypothetical protein
MSVQLALLKSGEEVIADIKEFRDSEENLVSYLFKDPHGIKIQTSKVLLEEESDSQKYEAFFYKWIALSKETDIIVNKDWIVAIVEPIDSIKKSYEEKMNGRGNSDGSASGRAGDGTVDTSIVFDEQFDPNQ